MNTSKFYYKKSKIQQLKGFCATVRNNCSIKQGAKELGIEESAISTQIRYLELDLGVKLFDRIKGRLYLNSNGEKVYAKAVSIISEVDNLFNNFLLANDEEYNNLLKIASVDAILVKIIPLSAKFDKNIKLYNLSKEKALEMLVKEEIDLAIYPLADNEKITPELKNYKLSKVNNYLCLSKNHPLSKKREIKKDDLLKFDIELIKDKIFLEKTCQKDSNKIVNNNLKLLKELVKNGIIISILSDVFIDKEDKKCMIFKNVSNFLPNKTYNI